MLQRGFNKLALGGVALAALLLSGAVASAQQRLPWERTQPPGQDRSNSDDGYQPAPPAPYQGGNYGQPRGSEVYAPPPQQGGYNSRAGSDAYRPPSSGGSYGTAGADTYRPPAAQGGYREPYLSGQQREPYDRDYGNEGPRQPQYAEPPRDYERGGGGYYSQNEIAQAGHGFFGSVSRGLASVIEYTFQKAGRPNGYILGEDAGGAFIAGLRYGEGRLHTKDAGTHKVFWQGPSIGYDVGGEGSKTMVLVYNLRDPSDIYHRFGGVQGTAYLVGGVSVQFQKYGDVVLAPIRSGVGLRLGANVGYLKYTREPTWNPF
jgi:hypothetical protein